jgi:hypothetical protein
MTKSKKKPGAKKGNKNALKHGLYSQFILETDVAGLKDMSDKNIASEIAMARVNLSNAMKELRAAPSAAKKLEWNFAAHYWLETVIDAILRSREQQQTAAVVWDNLLEAVRSANDRQGVR